MICYKSFVKRFLDIIISVIGLVILAPVIIIISVFIILYLGTPVLFRQKRPGMYGKPFTIYKFRTMRDLRNNKGDLLPDGDRLPTLGKYLRSSSLDELPELFNVLRGEMSIVGPRPLLIEYLDRYTPEQMRRHEVKPGITGWAQVNGRNAISWQERFDLDVWYVDNLSFLLDVKILLLTIIAVIKRRGITQPGHATIDKFLGNNKEKL